MWCRAVGRPRYADQAKKIVNVAVVNEDKNTRLIDALKAEVDALRKQLAEKESRLGLAPPAPITLYERVEVPVEVRTTSPTGVPSSSSSPSPSPRFGRFHVLLKIVRAVESRELYAHCGQRWGWGRAGAGAFV